jgi:phosphatidylglycerophosphate synthase
LPWAGCATSWTAASPAPAALVSPYGQFIDSTLDRFVEVFAFLGFVFYLRSFAWGPLVAAAAITGSLSSAIPARAESRSGSCARKA